MGYPVETNAEYNVLDPYCPSRVVLSRIGDRWTLLVMLALDTGTMRFSALREAVGVVTPKVLTETLRGLERDGLIHREAFAEVPPRVEYRLTELGESLLEPIQAVRNWAHENAATIMHLRGEAGMCEPPLTKEALLAEGDLLKITA